MKVLKGESIFVIFLILLLIFMVFRGLFVGGDIAVKAAETQGFTDVRVIDHAWCCVGLRGCGSKDAARFIVRAVNPAGKEVEFYVCVGWPFKGATIRVK